jgi:hypothetical protein
MQYCLFLFILVTMGCDNSTVRSKETNNIQSAADTAVKPDTTNELELSDYEFTGKAEISKTDSSFWVAADIRKDYRIFGYEKPDTNSRKMILFSVFTKEIQNNPNKCIYGSYYGSNAMEDAELKYIGEDRRFIKTILLRKANHIADIYFLKSQVTFIE